ncbi:MAG: hypothetical protein ACE5IM_07840 [Nitrospinota bacterium]
MTDSSNGSSTRDQAELSTNGRQGGQWPYVGEPPVYPPLSPWTRFQGGAFYVRLFTIFGICWTILCAAGIYYGMRNVAVVNRIGFWDAVSLRWNTGLWLWARVWLYPILATQAASIAIRLYYKRKGKPLRPSLSPGPVETAKE